jgi:glucosamine--fructose-6-phosphate aminotransferase (isomerizing)
MTPGEHTRSEIASQPDVWKATLREFRQQRDALEGLLSQAESKQIIAVGCGSTHYLSLSVAAMLRSKDIPGYAYPSAEYVYFPEKQLPGDTILLAISRSGTTSETLWAIEQFRERYPGQPVIAITTLPKSQVAEEADLVLSATWAQEVSIAQTRSFTSMFLLAQGLVSVLARDEAFLEALDRLPTTLEAVLERSMDIPQKLAADQSLKRFFFLGGGPLYGIASEAMIKTKEITASWAEAYYPLELRHGPMSVVNDEALVVGFISDSAKEVEIDVLKDMKALGAATLAIGEGVDGFDGDGLDDVVELDSGLSVWERGVLYLPLIQWMAYYRAIKTGLDPDRPLNLTAVVEL